MHQKERLAALKCVPILADLSPTQLEQVAGICKWQNYNAGEQILNYHDPSTDVFFLAAGKVRVIIYSRGGQGRRVHRPEAGSHVRGNRRD